MSDVTVTAAQVRPLQGALARMFDAGEAMDVGDLVYVAADGDVEQTDADAEATVTGQIGVVVSGSRADPDGSIASGERVSVVLHGPVYLGEDASLDETKLHYASVNKGKIANARSGNGNYDRPVGYPVSGTVLMLAPGAEKPTAYS